MHRIQYLLLTLALSLFLGACSALSGSSGEAGSDPQVAEAAYYYHEFTDVALPKEMRPVEKKTFITYAGGGTKVGTQEYRGRVELASLVNQEYRGRVELASLVNAMQSYMQRDGWTLRSVFRSHRSLLIFERAERMCSMYLEEGTFETIMLVFVSPKLTDGVVQSSIPQAAASSAMQYSVPQTTSIARMPNSDVTVYPAPLPQ
jgi:hypothetical protein